ncbi:MAG: tetratricopeptide repeat protein [Rubrivivax sp.]
MGVLRARILVAGARAKVEAARGRFDEARKAASAEIAMADEALQWASQDLGRKTDATADLTHRARLTLTAVLIESGLVFDAERALEDATRRQASLPTRSEVRLDAADLMVSLRIAQDRFDDAERLSQELVKLTADLPSGQASARHLRARLRWHAALAALGRWEDARAAIAETDRVFAASPSLRAAAEEDALVRGWVLLQLGEARAAFDVLEPARARARETFGPSSPDTALLTGLSAWAFWEQGMRSEALARFDEAMPRLMSSDGLVAQASSSAAFAMLFGAPSPPRTFVRWPPATIGLARSGHWRLPTHWWAPRCSRP